MDLAELARVVVAGALGAGAWAAGRRAEAAWLAQHGPLSRAPGYLQATVAGAWVELCAGMGAAALTVGGAAALWQLSGGASGLGALLGSSPGLWAALVCAPLGRHWRLRSAGGSRALPGVLTGPGGAPLHFEVTGAFPHPGGWAVQLRPLEGALGARAPAGCPEWVLLRGQVPFGRPLALLWGLSRLRAPGAGWGTRSSAEAQWRGGVLVRLERPLIPGERGGPGQLFLGLPGAAGRLDPDRAGPRPVAEARYAELAELLAAWGLWRPAAPPAPPAVQR